MQKLFNTCNVGTQKQQQKGKYYTECKVLILDLQSSHRYICFWYLCYR